MIVTCPNCTTNFMVDPENLGEVGRKVRCGECAFEWFQEPEFFDDEDDSDTETSEAEHFFVETEIDNTEDEDEDDPSTTYYQKTELSEQVLPKKKSIVGQIMALVLFIGVLSSLFFYKNTITKAWPDTYAIYDSLGLGHSSLLSKNDLSFERFEAQQKGDELEITGLIYNLRSDVLELPPLVFSLKNDANQVIEEVIISLDTPFIQKEGTLSVRQALTPKDVNSVKTVELRPVTPYDNITQPSLKAKSSHDTKQSEHHETKETHPDEPSQEGDHH